MSSGFLISVALILLSVYLFFVLPISPHDTDSDPQVYKFICASWSEMVEDQHEKAIIAVADSLATLLVNNM